MLAAGLATAAASQHAAFSPESNDENNALILSGALVVAAASTRAHKAATSDASNGVNGVFWLILAEALNQQ